MLLTGSAGGKETPASPDLSRGPPQGPVEAGPVAGGRVDVSVVIPAQNEAGNIESLVAEVVGVLDGWCEFEIVVVDDGSTDGTAAALVTLQNTHPMLRVLTHAHPCGQSLAVRSGVKAARAEVVATLDGDGQNDPRDLPRLWSILEAGSRADNVQLVIGHRWRRQDGVWRRVCSRVANSIRGRILGDNTPDSGCGIKVFFREAFLELPAFHHMHRFLPALFRRAGSGVLSVEVRHRPRLRGRSHYGTFSRLTAGVIDLAGMLWLIRRSRVPLVTERRRRPEFSPVDSRPMPDEGRAAAPHREMLRSGSTREPATVGGEGP